MNEQPDSAMQSAAGTLRDLTPTPERVIAGPSLVERGW
jgi:hypothetical protein